MTTFEPEVISSAPELRYDTAFTGSGYTASEAMVSGLGYSDYDWKYGHDATAAYNARTMYPVHESVDQQGHYLGYSSVPHNDIEFMSSPYIQTADMPFSTAMGHIPYGGPETYYAQPYNTISPSSTSSHSSSNSTGVGRNGEKPKRKRVQNVIQRKAANVRERRRMFHLNEAFDELRKRLPAFNYEKRLSRIETLRLAMTYIAFMKDVSDGKEPDAVQLLQIQRKSEQQYPDDSEDSE